MDPQRKGWGRLQDRAEQTSSSSSSSSSSNSNTISGGRRPRHFESSDEEPPPSRAEQAQGRGQAPGQGQGQSQPPPPTPPPPLQDRGRDPYGNVPCVGDTQYVPSAEGGNGGTVSQVTVLGDWDEELDPGEWWVVSHGSNGEGGKKGKKGKKRKREKEGGTFRVPGELLFRNREEAEAHLREALGAGGRRGRRG